MRTLANLKKTFFTLVAGTGALYAASHIPSGDAEATRTELVAPGQSMNILTTRVTKPHREIASSMRINVDQVTKNNLFVSTNWLPPAPPPPVPARPMVIAAPPLQAPPLPFSFVGLLEDRAKPTAFLSHGNALLIVSAGDTLEGGYRVDAVNSHEIALTYLPLNQGHRIQIVGEL